MGRYAVAITGASGAVYGVRLTIELLRRGDDVHAVVSPSGFLVAKEEMGLDGADAIKKHIEAATAVAVGAVGTAAASGGGKGAKGAKGALHMHDHDDLLAPLASGSARIDAMVICPCSMGTLARVATGVSGNLIERSADCMIKEGRPLVIVPRETPLSPIHLENMTKLSRIGVKVVPAMPAFYHHPESVEDMVDFVVGKALDALGIENELFERWKGK